MTELSGLQVKNIISCELRCFLVCFPSQVCVRLRAIALPFLQLHAILSITFLELSQGAAGQLCRLVF